MDKETLERYAELMVEGFKNDPGEKWQLNGIENGWEIFKLQSLCQLDVFSKLNCLTTYGDGEGLVLGYFLNNEFLQQLANQWQQSEYVMKMTRQIPQQVLMQLKQQQIEVMEVAQPDWYVKFIGDKEVYVLQIIVIKEELRGTGVF